MRTHECVFVGRLGRLQRDRDGLLVPTNSAHICGGGRGTYAQSDVGSFLWRLRTSLGVEQTPPLTVPIVSAGSLSPSVSCTCGRCTKSSKVNLVPYLIMFSRRKTTNDSSIRSRRAMAAVVPHERTRALVLSAASSLGSVHIVRTKNAPRDRQAPTSPPLHLNNTTHRRR